MRLSLILLFLCGCLSTENHSSHNSTGLTIHEILLLLNREGIERRFVHFTDRGYAPVTDSWIEGLIDKHRDMLELLDVSTGLGWECEEWASSFALMAQVKFADNPWTNEDAVAVGWMCYVTDRGDGHAVSIVITVDREIVIIDPSQDYKIVSLSDSEKDSASKYPIIF